MNLSAAFVVTPNCRAFKISNSIETWRSSKSATTESNTACDMRFLNLKIWPFSSQFRLAYPYATLVSGAGCQRKYFFIAV